MSSLIQVVRSTMSVVITLLDDPGMYSANRRFAYDNDHYDKHKSFLDFIKLSMCLPYEVHLNPGRLDSTNPNQVLFLLQLRAANKLKYFQSAGFFRSYKIVLDDSSQSPEYDEDIILSHFTLDGRYGGSLIPYSPALKRVCGLISRIMCCDVTGKDVFYDYSPVEVGLIAGHMRKENFNSTLRSGARPKYAIINNWPSILPARR